MKFHVPVAGSLASFYRSQLRSLTSLMRLLVFAFGVFGLVSAPAQTQVPHEFQAGQPARASEVNANFDALEAAIDAQSTESASNEALLEGLLYRIERLSMAVYGMGREIACSALNLAACNSLLSTQNLSVSDYWISVNTLLVTDQANAEPIFAYVWQRNVGPRPDVTNDRVLLLFGRQANFTRGVAVPDAEVLVDDCENPTVYLVPSGASRTGGLGVNNGKIYIGDSQAAAVTVDVTGGTYGLIHDYTKGLPVQDSGVSPPPPSGGPPTPPPLCSPVSDRVGSYDSYPLILRADTSTWGQEWALTAEYVTP
jgi:hypothetical protein